MTPTWEQIDHALELLGERDRKIAELEEENKRLRAALELIANGDVDALRVPDFAFAGSFFEAATIYARKALEEKPE